LCDLQKNKQGLENGPKCRFWSLPVFKVQCGKANVVGMPAKATAKAFLK
jgi:hypothetical protein